MSDVLKAPWTLEQVINLNDYQSSGIYHPYTCGNRDDGKHLDDGILVATYDGWECRFCSYKQDWALAASAQPIPIELTSVFHPRG